MNYVMVLKMHSRQFFLKFIQSCRSIRFIYVYSDRFKILKTSPLLHREIRRVAFCKRSIRMVVAQRLERQPTVLNVLKH